MTVAAEPQISHLTSISALDRAAIDALLERASQLHGHRDQVLAGRIMATVFYEPSTRTRLSFESAMVRRGGSVISVQTAATNSSAAKGESLHDSIKVISSYADVVVIRHPAQGAAQIAADASRVPIINAGDGSGEHPSQALLDLYTIKSELGAIDGRHIVLCGDLAHARTTHSLLIALCLYENIRVSLISPAELRMPQALVQRAKAAGLAIAESETIRDVLESCEVLYQTRLQTERAAPDESPPSRVVVDATLMARLSPRAIVMQPLPRTDDITPDVDADPRAAYFRQAANGIPVRMALLERLLGGVG